MDTEFTEEQEQLRASVRRFLAERAPIAFARERWDDPRGTTDAVWKGLCELGLVGLLAPPGQGGEGGDVRDMGVVLAELGRVAHPGPFAASAVGAVSAAVASGDDALVRALAAGSRVGTVAIAEPGRSPAAWTAPATRADGDRLFGEKHWVPHGATADVAFVTARDGVYRLDLRAGATPGLRVEPAASVDGTRRFATLHLDGAPAVRLCDLDAFAPVVDRLLVAGAADALGAAEACLERSVAYAKERTQFGRPIGAFQAVSHLCADMLQDVELTRAGVHYALWAQDCADPAERHRAAVLARAQSALALPPVAAHAIQIHGGAGYTWEVDLHLFYKRLLTHQQELGAPEDWLDELARIVC